MANIKQAEKINLYYFKWFVIDNKWLKVSNSSVK